MKTRRPYVMRARADSAAATRRRILESVMALHWERGTTEITLDDAAARAGVAVQTVIRIFGTRAALMEEASRLILDELREERLAPPGDVDTAVRVLFDHYEKRGAAVVKMLSQESLTGHPGMGEGRRKHRAWVETTFAPQLASRVGADREVPIDLLVVAADVYTWKLLRQDRGLDRGGAEARVERLIVAILAG